MDCGPSHRLAALCLWIRVNIKIQNRQSGCHAYFAHHLVTTELRVLDVDKVDGSGPVQSPFAVEAVFHVNSWCFGFSVSWMLSSPRVNKTKGALFCGLSMIGGTMLTMDRFPKSESLDAIGIARLCWDPSFEGPARFQDNGRGFGLLH